METDNIQLFAVVKDGNCFTLAMPFEVSDYEAVAQVDRAKITLMMSANHQDALWYADNQAEEHLAVFVRGDRTVYVDAWGDLRVMFLDDEENGYRKNGQAVDLMHEKGYTDADLDEKLDFGCNPWFCIHYADAANKLADVIDNEIEYEAAMVLALNLLNDDEFWKVQVS
jgi:hypothetical protein